MEKDVLSAVDNTILDICDEIIKRITDGLIENMEEVSVTKV